MHNLWSNRSRITQGLTLIMVSVLFFLWGVFGAATVDRQNDAILRGVRAEVVAHGRGSQIRSCAIAKEIAYLVKQTPDLKPRIARRVDRFTETACSFTDVPEVT